MVNPHQTGFFGIQKFKPWHVNLEYAKFDQLKNVKAPIETLIVGSSTSEAYVASDVEEVFGSKAYVVSLGGADTPSRMAVIFEAMKRFSSLKRIIYIADFFEFNRPKAKPEVAFQPEMGELIPLFAKGSVVDFCKYYLSNQSFEDVFNVLKRRKKDKRLSINLDGTMNQSMILSPLKSDSSPQGLLNEEQKKKLSEQISENYQTYSRNVLKEMKNLNPKVIELYRNLLERTKAENIKLNFILSPYHHDFKASLSEVPNFEKNYELWKVFLTELGERDHVHTLDTTNHFIATHPMSAVWRDGIHYNRESAMSFLRELSD